MNGHRVLKRLTRQGDAQALVDKYVRFAHLPENSQALPILVLSAESNGMIRLAGWAGLFAPHLFVVVDPPKKRHA
jgi:hypothetical protein